MNFLCSAKSLKREVYLYSPGMLGTFHQTFLIAMKYPFGISQSQHTQVLAQLFPSVCLWYY